MCCLELVLHATPYMPTTPFPHTIHFPHRLPPTPILPPKKNTRRGSLVYSLLLEEEEERKENKKENKRQKENLSVMLLCPLFLFCFFALNKRGHYGTKQPRGTGPLTRPFAHLLAPLTHSLDPHCLLHSRALRRSFPRLLTHSLTPLRL